ncbi:hypothetical protein XENTR_v10007252 [Xenopus tropicalis]|nr:hypothetical protein XENTR_v10007252 [Xenopus tropicalis]
MATLMSLDHPCGSLQLMSQWVPMATLMSQYQLCVRNRYNLGKHFRLLFRAETVSCPCYGLLPVTILICTRTKISPFPSFSLSRKISHVLIN